MTATTDVDPFLTSPEEFVRPNGKPYRPRKKGLEVREFYADNDTTGVIVFGTHSPIRAVYAAFHSLHSFDLGPEDCTVAWWRLVPWSHSYEFEFTYIDDPDRGRPCVVFQDA